MSDPINTDIVSRLDQIELHLRHLDNRDRTRMIWSSVRSVIGLGLFLAALFGGWYFLDHLGEIMKTVVQESAKQSQQAVKTGSQDFLKQMQEMFKK